MDDLDRLAFRLVRTVRSSHPQLLTQEFTLTDLEERLLAFRDARREMSSSGPEAWELTMLRIVSGERHYLTTSADLQLACRQALSQASPTLALVRAWSATTLRLGAAALSLGTERDTLSGAASASEAATHATHAPLLRLATPSGRRGTGEVVAVGHTRSHPSASAGGCRYCGGKVPEGRTITFCPHCGVNLTVRQCPACSTELDITWRFCVTCGRGPDLPDLPAYVARPASIAV